MAQRKHTRRQVITHGALGVLAKAAAALGHDVAGAPDRARRAVAVITEPVTWALFNKILVAETLAIALPYDDRAELGGLLYNRYALRLNDATFGVRRWHEHAFTILLHTSLGPWFRVEHWPVTDDEVGAGAALDDGMQLPVAAFLIDTLIRNAFHPTSYQLPGHRGQLIEGACAVYPGGAIDLRPTRELWAQVRAEKMGC